MRRIRVKIGEVHEGEWRLNYTEWEGSIWFVFAPKFVFNRTFGSKEACLTRMKELISGEKGE